MTELTNLPAHWTPLPGRTLKGGGQATVFPIRHDDGHGALCLHPLNASFGNFSSNDLGGSAEGVGVLASVAEVRAFIVSVFENESYWEYVASG